MNAVLHIIIGGKDSFCNYMSELLLNLIREKVYITPNVCTKLLLINTRIHQPDTVILEDNLKDTDIVIQEIKQSSMQTKVVLFTPRKKAEIKNADFVFPLKTTETLPVQLAEIFKYTPVKTIENQFLKETEQPVFYKRELEVFEGVMLRKKNEDIGKGHFIGKRTIETHRKNLYRKAGVYDLIGIVIYGMRNKWIEEHGNLTKLFFELRRNAE